MFHGLSGNKEKLGFSILVKVDPCAVASLLVGLKGKNFGCRIFISFQVGRLIIIDSAPECIEKSYFKVWCLQLFGFWTFLKKWDCPCFFLCNCGSLGMF